jgi:methylated-DNA-[protein]-cysteine S-methyltransferase
MTMHEAGFRLFDTAIGRCGIAWGDAGIVSVLLPGASDDATRRRLRRRLPRASEVAPPPRVQRAIDHIVALLEGTPTDLASVELDMTDVPAFDRQVYRLARTIPPGETLTYGGLAARLGTPGDARGVGQALARNPFAVVVPCHRVVGAHGQLGGFSAAGGAATKLKLLAIERARVSYTPRLFD